MDGIVILLLLLLALVLAGGALCGIAALVETIMLRRKVARLDTRLAELTRAMRQAERSPISAQAQQALLAVPVPPPQPPESQTEPPPQEKPAAEAPADLPPKPPPEPRSEPRAIFPPPPAHMAEAAPADWGRLEDALGRKWTVWVGVLILLAGAGFFVKYAFEQGWISPAARVGAGIVAGLALAALGARFQRLRMRALGQGMMGGGLGLLYLSLYAGYHFYDVLIPLPWAFGAMIAVTVLGVLLAVLLDAQPVCALATIGGFLTPLLLSTGQDARDTLFTYLMILNLGVLAVAWFKGWRLLDGLALAGTAVLFTGWAAHFCPVPAPAPAAAWLAGFYAVFLLMPIASHLHRRTPATVERFVFSWICAAYFFSMALWMAGPDRTPLAWATLAASAAYAGLGLLARWRIPQDRRSLHGFATLAMFFLALAPAFAWDLYGPTLAWALLAVALVALGGVFQYLPLRIGGDAFFLMANLSLIANHRSLPIAEYAPFATRESAILWAVVLAGAAAAWLRHRCREEATPWDRPAKVAAANLAGLVAVVGLHRELWHWRALAHDPHTGRWLAPLVWTTGAAAYMEAGVRLRCAASRWVAAGALLLAMGMAAVSYDSPWGARHLPAFNPRFAAALAAVVVAFAFGQFLTRFKDRCGEDAKAAPVMHGIGVAALFLLLSAEARAACIGLLPPDISRGWITQMALSLTWAAYASCLLCVGFWRRLRPVRLAGLGFFGLTSLKVVFVDMARVGQLYRIATFVALGLLMIGASYLYHRLERLMESPARD